MRTHRQAIPAQRDRAFHQSFHHQILVPFHLSADLHRFPDHRCGLARCHAHTPFPLSFAALLELYATPSAPSQPNWRESGNTFVLSRRTPGHLRHNRIDGQFHQPTHAPHLPSRTHHHRQPPRRTRPRPRLDHPYGRRRQRLRRPPPGRRQRPRPAHLRRLLLPAPRIHPSPRLAPRPAPHPGLRPLRTPLRNLARRRPQLRLARRHRRKLGARPLLPRRPPPPRLPRQRRPPQSPRPALR